MGIKFLDEETKSTGKVKFLDEEIKPEKQSDALAGWGQLLGGISGGIGGATVGHPYIGSAIGGTLGRVKGRLMQEELPYMAQHPIKSTLEKLAPIPFLSEIQTIRRMTPESKQQFGEEMKTTAGVEAIGSALGFGAMKGLGQVAKQIGKSQGALHNVTLKMKDKLGSYIRNLHQEYGQRLDSFLERIGTKNVLINTEELAGSMLNRLQQANIIDDSGKYIGINNKEKVLFDLYENIVDNAKKQQFLSYQSIKKYDDLLKEGISKSTKAGTKLLDKFERVYINLKGDIGEAIERGLSSESAKELKSINKWYAPKRQLFNNASKIFKPFTGEFDTRQAVSQMRDYYNPNKQDLRNLFSTLEKELGFDFVSTAKRHSSLKELGRFPWLGNMMDALVGAGRLTESTIGEAVKPVQPAFLPLLKTGITEMTTDQ